MAHVTQADYSDLSLLQGIPNDHVLYTQETLSQFLTILNHPHCFYTQPLKKCMDKPGSPVRLKTSPGLEQYIEMNGNIMHVKFVGTVYKNYSKDGPYGNKETIDEEVCQSPSTTSSLP